MDLKGFNHYKKSTWSYFDLESDRRPVPHCEEVPVPEFSELPDIFMEHVEFYEELESSASKNSEVYLKVVHRFQSNLSRRS